MKAAINALPTSRTGKAQNLVKTQTDFRVGPFGAVVLAAQGRKMSLSSYMRRAIYAMAAHDLGLPVSDLISRDPRVARETGFAIDDPDGVKFGPWGISALIETGGDREPGPNPSVRPN